MRAPEGFCVGQPWRKNDILSRSKRPRIAVMCLKQASWAVGLHRGHFVPLSNLRRVGRLLCFLSSLVCEGQTGTLPKYSSISYGTPANCPHATSGSEASDADGSPRDHLQQVHAAVIGHGRAAGADRHGGSHQRRKRGREGAYCPCPASLLAPRQQSLGGYQLRGPFPAPRPERVVRL